MAARGTVTVVGAGPNGLAAAVVLARAGLTVRVLEASDTPGGGCRTEELVEPGTVHDPCAAVVPGVLTSPFFTAFELARRVELVVPEISYGQARVGRDALLAHHDLARTVEGLGRDGAGWRRVFAPLVERAGAVARLTGGNPLGAVRQPATALRFGLPAARQWQPLPALRALRGDARDLFAGPTSHVNHRFEALSAPLTGMALAVQGHTAGWPVPRGGASAVVRALVDDALAHGAELHCSTPVRRLADLPPSDAVLFDTSLPGLLEIAGTAVPASYRARARGHRTGAAVGKVDLVLSAPLPWSDPRLHGASTVHLGGSHAEMAAAEREVHAGRVPEHPVLLVSCPTDLDPSRSRTGRHVVWAYAHLPTGCPIDPTEIVLRELERHAPGVRDLVVGHAARPAATLAGHNDNYRGGDIYAGALSTRQTLLRPVPALDPWRVGRTDLYLCSSAAAPGPGVHGMGGWHAARSALRHTFGGRLPLPSLAPRPDQV
ncbi:NAD(P)-binding protein [Auraticoccus sp. F435]|uniref:NAD(P)-binding protein n=1 Tax=Auraticoccus cholistanensis TaxID=2656650 RepID=A0A6A9US46_9ACTN|nr:NAD(P)-binding protein [Auraticoccus cholistanensis]